MKQAMDTTQELKKSTEEGRGYSAMGGEQGYSAMPEEKTDESHSVEAPRDEKSVSSKKSDNAPMSLGSAKADGKYRIIEKLGRGSQGEVYHAKRLSDGVDVAIKVLHIHSVNNWKQYELFHREAETLMGLDIDGVAHLYETIEDLECENPVSIIVQEYIRGYSLKDYLQSARRFSLSDIADIIKQLLEIVEKLHTRPSPIIHRDIKPGNIMLVDELGKFKVWLIDFGAVANPQVKDGGSTVAGTYGYMPPEQLMGNPVPQSDIYAIGALALHLLSRQPLEEIEMQDFRYMIDPYLQHLPYSVTQLLRKMLEPNIRDRISDISILKAAFEAIRVADFKQLGEIVGSTQGETVQQQVSITSYRQSGAIDAWSLLSDLTPRKEDLPKSIVASLKQIHPDIISQISAHGENTASTAFNMTRYVKDYDSSMIYGLIDQLRYHRRPYVKVAASNRLFSIVLSSLAALICVAVALVSFLLYTDMVVIAGIPSVEPIWYILLITLFVVLFMVSIKNIVTNVNSKIDYVENLKKNIDPLFRYGRKTIATISKIEFACDIKSLEPIEQPLWRVEYKYNPPDDESPDDITGEFYTRLPLEDTAVGDFVPCIYIIVREDDGSESVFSSPWPILEQDDIYLVKDVERLLCREIPVRPDQILDVE